MTPANKNIYVYSKVPVDIIRYLRLRYLQLKSIFLTYTYFPLQEGLLSCSKPPAVLLHVFLFIGGAIRTQYSKLYLASDVFVNPEMYKKYSGYFVNNNPVVIRGNNLW